MNKKYSKEELEKYIFIDNISYEEIGRIYNVTGNAIKKAALRYGLKLPQRRYINIKETFNINELPANCVHINHYISDKELAQYIQRSKLIVLPYRDATGTQTIQSVFYYKKPIIATSVGCFPEYITDQEDGIIVPSGSPTILSDAIEKLLVNEKKRKEMGINGNRKLSTIFNNKLITEQYIQIFKSV